MAVFLKILCFAVWLVIMTALIMASRNIYRTKNQEAAFLRKRQ